MIKNVDKNDNHLIHLTAALTYGFGHLFRLWDCWLVGNSTKLILN